MTLLVVQMGLTDYEVALRLQNKLVNKRQNGRIPDIMLLLEHAPVITVGKMGHRENIVAPEELLRTQGVSIHIADRGGDVTYHGPGQIVGYPIIDLAQHGCDINDYIYRLEEVFIQLLDKEYGVKSMRDSNYPGVWVSSKKIAAIGCSVKRWVTKHGFAFNVNTNLEHYSWIIPCGITGRGVTSLKEVTGQVHDIDTLYNFVSTYFCMIHNMIPEIVDQEGLKYLIGE